MALKTFNIDHETYEKFRERCQKEGRSMSKHIENFMKREIESVKVQKKIVPEAVKDSEGKIHSFQKFC